MTRASATSPVITIDDCTVRVIAGEATKLGVPRRQGFAWASNAREYAEKLSREHGWPIAGIIS